MTRQVTNTFQAASIKAQPVPKRMTPMFQPADVAWMRPLKVAYFKKWNEWLINGAHSYTAAGNMKSPGYAQAIAWISEIWAGLDSN